MKYAPELLGKLAVRIDASGGADACHPWTGSVHTKKGMVSPTPIVSLRKSNYNPRKVVYEVTRDVDLPFGQRVSDNCGNTICCNPSHLVGGSVLDRVLDRVDQSGGPDACWPYRGHLSKGYGRIRVGHNGPRKFAHRIMWEQRNGRELRDDELCLHSCDNAKCCNPAHLRPGTDAENIADMWNRNRGSQGEKHGESVKRAREAKAAGYVREKKRGGRKPRAA